MPLEMVSCPVFRTGMLGVGCGIKPTEDVIVSPVAATVVAALPHAVALRCASGLEVLVHAGVDTCAHHEAFELYVAPGDEVRVGTELLRMHRAQVEACDLDNTVMLMASNQYRKEALSMIHAAEDLISTGDELMSIEVDDV